MNNSQWMVRTHFSVKGKQETFVDRVFIRCLTNSSTELLASTTPEALFEQLKTGQYLYKVVLTGRRQESSVFIQTQSGHTFVKYSWVKLESVGKITLKLLEQALGTAFDLAGLAAILRGAVFSDNKMLAKQTVTALLRNKTESSQSQTYAAIGSALDKATELQREEVFCAILEALCKHSDASIHVLGYNPHTLCMRFMSTFVITGMLKSFKALLKATNVDLGMNGLTELLRLAVLHLPVEKIPSTVEVLSAEPEGYSKLTTEQYLQFIFTGCRAALVGTSNIDRSYPKLVAFLSGCLSSKTIGISQLREAKRKQCTYPTFMVDGVNFNAVLLRELSNLVRG